MRRVADCRRTRPKVTSEDGESFAAQPARFIVFPLVGVQQAELVHRRGSPGMLGAQ